MVHGAAAVLRAQALVASAVDDQCTGLSAAAMAQCACIGQIPLESCNWTSWSGYVYTTCVTNREQPCAWDVLCQVSGSSEVKAFCKQYAGHPCAGLSGANLTSCEDSIPPAPPRSPPPSPPAPPASPAPFAVALCATTAIICACCDVSCDDCRAGPGYSCPPFPSPGICDCGYGAQGYDTYLSTSGALPPAICATSPPPPPWPPTEVSPTEALPWFSTQTAGVIAWWIVMWLLFAALMGCCVRAYCKLNAGDVSDLPSEFFGHCCDPWNQIDVEPSPLHGTCTKIGAAICMVCCWPNRPGCKGWGIIAIMVVPTLMVMGFLWAANVVRFDPHYENVDAFNTG